MRMDTAVSINLTKPLRIVDYYQTGSVFSNDIYRRLIASENKCPRCKQKTLFRSLVINEAAKSSVEKLCCMVCETAYEVCFLTEEKI